jgi:hypothetical protein
MADSVKESPEKTSKTVRRLCNEIQLFDLCEREKCRHKEGLFCTDEELLNRFEAIADIEERPAEGLISGEADFEDASDEYGCDDVFEDEEYPDDGEGEDEEDE